MATKDWIQSATKHSHGQFAAKAKAAHETTLEFARKHDKGNSKLAEEARLAERLIHASRSK